MSQQPPSHVKPGNTYIFATPVYVRGLLTDVAGLLVTLEFFDKSTQGPTAPIRDSQGQYHIDMLIPLATAPGPAWCRWQATGVPVDANVLVEQMFIVDPLAF